MIIRKFRGMTSHLILTIVVASIALVITGFVMTGHENKNNTQNPIRIASFEADATPDIGTPLAYNPTKRVEMPLSARGVVLVGNGDPIVLCAVDWIGIGNKARDAWQEALADAAGTTPDRVAVHVLHQHDAPLADYNAFDILTEFGIDPSGTQFDNRDFVEQTIERTAGALRDAMDNNLQTVTHIGTGTAIVEKVASNRRVIDRSGTVPMRRNSSTSDVEAKRKPVGTIDPEVMMLSFWNGDEPLVVLSYYATHPQSYYRTGGANPDFPGIARAGREAETGVRHIHFNGAGGNVAAGKWNRGWTEKRQILADRLADGMAEAWEQTERIPVDASQLEWRIEPVALPPGEHLVQENLEQTLREAATEGETPTGAARHLGWLRRTMEGDEIDLTALRVGPARILHTPGELAIEYQLFARSLYPDDFIANASYGDYDPGYISTEIQYQQGSYEASDRASRVAPEVEQALLPGIREVLAFEAFQPDPDRQDVLGYRLERSAMQYGYDGEYSWVNGRAGVIPARVSINPISKPTIVLMAHEVEHSGPDIFQGLHYFRSRDLGLNWEGPFEESVFERESVDEDTGQDRLVTDFSPKFHAETETLLGIGHIAIYEENRLIAGQTREIAYATFDPHAQRWLQWQPIDLPEEIHGGNPVAASGRRVDLDNGTILFPVYVNDSESEQLHITVVRSRFNGESLEYIEHGNMLTVDSGSDLHEPSLTEFNGSYYLTFRTDEQLYVTRSDNGLQFDEPHPWRYDDGRNLASDETRQHWVTHSDNLYLAYTRQEGESLFLGQVDPAELHIVAQTEHTIIPAERGGHLDKLDVVDVSEDETWIMATEWVEPSVVGGQYAFNNLIHIARLNWFESN